MSVKLLEQTKSLKPFTTEARRTQRKDTFELKETLLCV